MTIGPYSRAGLALVFVPLYAGPVLAGLARHPVAVIPVLAVIFLFFISATRKPDLHQPGGMAAFVIMALVQLVIVGAVFGAASLAASLIAPLTLPLWLPIVLSGAAAAFGAWRYSDQAEMDVFLDSAIAQIEALDTPPTLDPDDLHWAATPEAQAALDRTEAALLALPEDTRIHPIDPIVQDLEQEAGMDAFDAFFDLVTDAPEENRRLALGFLRFMASPNIRRQAIERGESGLCVTPFLNATDPGVRSEARGVLYDLIDDQAPADQLPDIVFLAQLAQDFPGEGYGQLNRLCTPPGQEPLVPAD